MNNPRVVSRGVLLLSLVMIPFGMPGTLVMFAAALCYKLLVPQGGIGWPSVVVVGILMAPVIERVLGEEAVSQEAVQSFAAAVADLVLHGLLADGEGGGENAEGP